MINYTVYNVYKKETETYNVECASMDEVHLWIENNLNLKYGWTIQEGEKRTLFKLDCYKVSEEPSRSDTIKVIKTSKERLTDKYFLTKEEAIENYKKYKEIAKAKLENIEKELILYAYVFD